MVDQAEVRKCIQRAEQIFVSDPANPKECVDLANKLQAANYFTHARKLLKCAKLANADETLSYNIRRNRAVFTYKDQDKPAEERLNEAQGILESLANEPAPTGDPNLKQDVFGILRAVHKKHWELDGQKEHLVRLFGWYERGYKLSDQARFYGYTALNAAFIKDLLAHAQSTSLIPYEDSDAKRLHDDAENIRKELLAKKSGRIAGRYQKWVDAGAPVSENETMYWDCVTLGEAFLGIGSYQTACEWMKRAANVPVDPWNAESSARQIARLARIECSKRQSALDAKPGPWDVLNALVGDNTGAADSFHRSKVGLALSGGGFRASLFHIGVLAKLAELDLLRHIEVISCVSGGSIVGTYYYLDRHR